MAKFKTKQQEIDWLRSEIGAYRDELKELHETITELRKSNSINDAIVNRLGSICWKLWPDGSDLGDLIEALVQNHDSYVALVRNKKAFAELRVDDADKLIASLLFVARCTCNSSNANYLGGEKLFVTMERILKQACKEISSLVIGDRGLLRGSQDSQVRDHVEEFRSKHA